MKNPAVGESSMGGRKFRSADELPPDAVLLRYTDAFPPSHKREYVEWITEAKQEATRQRRLATAIEWMAQGKSRNWKYENC